MKDITQELVKKLFNYKQGKLYWLKPNHGKINVGDEAGWFNKVSGYYQIFINGRCYYRHRIIWLYYNGYLPRFIDHKYGKEIGDYLWNLRPCDRFQNMANSKLRKNNKSGYKGIKWNEKANTWTAQLRYKKTLHYIGTFNDLGEAIKSISSKREELHGKFANHG